MSVVEIVDHPLIQHKISLLRDRNTGTKEFRDLVSEIAMLLCYEATRDLPTEEVEVETPVALARTKVLAGRKLALVPILRAGLGMVDGMLNLIPAAKVGHIGMYRNEETLEPVEYYCKLPNDINEREVFVLDPMLATGGSASDAIGQIKARGAKGTVGTQATFIELFNGDHARVRELDRRVAEKIGFDQVFAVTGQTYPRKLDMKIAETLAGIAASAHKFAVDLRLLSNLKVQEEPFESKQVGSSAMAYKRNPMRSERMTGLARKLMGLPANFAATAANQWFERTLDDSAIRRMDLAQAFLLSDAILKLYINITADMVVYPKQIEKHLLAELPFMATEKILMACVERGKSRQEMHEVIREHSVAAGLDVKNQGLDNNLLARLADDPRVPFDQHELRAMVSDFQQFTGRAAEQTDEFLAEVVRPVLARYSDLGGDIDASLQV